MKCIIAGSRTINQYILLEAAIDASGWADLITEVVSGCARGADALGEEWAYKNHKKLMQFPADWDAYGKSAGIRRNELMARYGDRLIALHENNSKGTTHMISIMRKLGKEVYVYEV